MIFCLIVNGFKRIGSVAGPALLSMLVLSGCDNQYASDLKYPARTDPLVTGSLETAPKNFDKPGEFPPQKVSDFRELAPEMPEKDLKNILDPNAIKPETRKTLESLLEETFGTPLNPKVARLDPLDQETLKLDSKTLAEGSHYYRLHCLHCHGVAGNGRGPTAPWVNPHPRDYRQGIFKFTSTKGGNERKPRREDLHRTIKEGIEGTSMPSFALLTDRDLNALVSYVIHLSMRGEAEFTLMQGLLNNQIETGELNREKFDEYFIGPIVKDAWMKAAEEKNWIKPDPALASAVKFPPTRDQKQSVVNGYKLFKSSDAAGCIGCHLDYGRQSKLFFDKWGTVGRPADLTTGVYRGGRRPLDFFYRLHQGVNGSSMPAFGSLLKDEQIWDLVSFLEVLPHPKMLKEFGIDINEDVTAVPAAQ